MQENVILGGFDSLPELTPEFLVATAVIPRGIYKLHSGLSRVGQAHQVRMASSSALTSSRL
jgi:hypothetical protein